MTLKPDGYATPGDYEDVAIRFFYTQYPLEAWMDVIIFYTVEDCKASTIVFTEDEVQADVILGDSLDLDVSIPRMK